MSCDINDFLWKAWRNIDKPSELRTNFGSLENELVAAQPSQTAVTLWARLGEAQGKQLAGDLSTNWCHSLQDTREVPQCLPRFALRSRLFELWNHIGWHSRMAQTTCVITRASPCSIKRIGGCLGCFQVACWPGERESLLPIKWVYASLFPCPQKSNWFAQWPRTGFTTFCKI